MEKYCYPLQELKMIEGLQAPLAVYQFIRKRVVTVALSDGFLKAFGYTDRNQAIRDMDSNMFAAAHPDDVKRVADASVRFAEEGTEYDVVYRTRTKSSPDAYRMVHARGEQIETADGVRLSQVWYMDEGPYAEQAASPAERVNAGLGNALHEESILRGNRYDFLTGLPGLAYFFELAEAGRNVMQARGEDPVLVYMDLNGMKYFNHQNSFAEGDRMLKAFARVLAEIFSNENCCHIGADRFAAFTKREGLEETLGRLFDEAAKANGGRMLPVRAGLYSAGTEDVPASTAYDRAKMACDVARKTDSSEYAWYSEELQRKNRHRLYIQASIDRAIRENWIQVYYQPIVRAVNLRVCDEEALARWIDPTEGFMPPAEFIPELEQSGQIYKLDLYVVEQVLDKIRRQAEAGMAVVPQSVNLSRADFDACDIVEEIRKRVDAAGVSRKMIVIELTESMIGSGFEFMKEQVGRFRELGFPVWMDDFGSGYSSLDMLQSIRFDLIKFDMSFTRKLEENASARIILTELMKLAARLGVDTVCEGVETAEQLRFLQEIGCAKLQGYYFCRPLPFADVLRLHREGMKYSIENPETSAYYEAIGRINLNDLGMVAGGEEDFSRHTFSSVPMGIIEIRGGEARFARSNASYREFMQRAFGFSISEHGGVFGRFDAPFMVHVARACGGPDSRTFFNERMPDGSVIHSFARRIGTHPVTGVIAVAVAVLSLTEPEEGGTEAAGGRRPAGISRQGDEQG